MVFFVGAQSQLQEGLAHLFLEQAGENLERRLHSVLTALTVSLLEGLREVKDLREAIRHLQRLQSAGKLESLGKEGLGYLGSQVPLAIAVKQGLCTERTHCLFILPS